MGNDAVVEDMKNVLQQEIAMEEKAKLAEHQKVQEDKYVQENQGFMDELKGLWSRLFIQFITFSLNLNKLKNSFWQNWELWHLG